MIQYLVRTSERIWETGKSLKYLLGLFSSYWYQTDSIHYIFVLNNVVEWTGSAILLFELASILFVR